MIQEIYSATGTGKSTRILPFLICDSKLFKSGMIEKIIYVDRVGEDIKDIITKYIISQYSFFKGIRRNVQALKIEIESIKMDPYADAIIELENIENNQSEKAILVIDEADLLDAATLNRIKKYKYPHIIIMAQDSTYMKE